MPALTFLIRLLEPVLATQAQSGEANSSTASTYIPGSMIRGALVPRLYPQGLDAGDDEARRLFFDGAVCYLNAYPAHPNASPNRPYDGKTYRMLPKPLSWFVPKDQAKEPEAKIFDFAIRREDWEKPAKSPGRGDYVTVATHKTVQLGKPAVRVTVHNASQDPNRKREGDSQVFRYEAIAAGEVLAGAIVTSVEHTDLLKKILPHLTGEFLMGGSYTAGYGRVRIEAARIDTIWQEYVADPQPFAGNVILTCLSDVILRGSNGQVDTDWKARSGEKPTTSFYHMRLVGGFNRRWGLPLPQAWAIAAGSIFVFPASVRPTLEKLVESGIGDRRAEGFGRIALDWHTQPTYSQSALPPRTSASSSVPPLSTESKKLARQMANRQLQAKLDNWLAKQISNLAQGGRAFRNLPSPAQLSQARTVARQAWAAGDLKLLDKYFDDIADSRLRSRAWDRARVGDKLLRSWILDTVETAKNLELDSIPEVAGESADLNDQLRQVTIARLIEGVIRQAVKHAKGEAETRGGYHGSART